MLKKEYFLFKKSKIKSYTLPNGNIRLYLTCFFPDFSCAIEIENGSPPTAHMFAYNKLKEAYTLQKNRISFNPSPSSQEQEE